MSDDKMKVDLSNILNISARVSAAIIIAGILILFFPEQWLPFRIDDFRNQYGLWVFIVTIVAGAIGFSYVIKWITEKIKQAISRKRLWNSYRTILLTLADDEKRFIKQFYEKRTSAVQLDLSNPMMKRLETFGLLSPAAGRTISPAPYCPGFIQPWVFQLIDKNPDYIKVEDKPHGR